MVTENLTTEKAEISIFSKEIHPFKQAGVALALMFLSLLVTKGIQKETTDPVVFWEVSLSVLMGFCLFNSIFSFSYPHVGKYFRDSIYSYVAVAAIGGYAAYLFSGLSIDEAGAFRWLYLVFTFSYLVFISIVNTMRKILELVKKQDARLRGEDV